jgi:predicted cupin superfamily sugar epimerase
MNKDEVIETLQLEPLEHEGGLFRRMYISEHSSAIYYLLARPDFSALHRLTETEVYHWYGGSALDLLLLHADGSVDTPRLGPDLAAGERPQVVVPGGTVHGSMPVGDWSLVGTTMSPPFRWEGFRLGQREELIQRYPFVADRITELTRVNEPATDGESD